MSNVVYFVRRADGTGLTKIGTSAFLDERLRTLSVAHKAPLAILASAPGSYREERRMHLQLADHRVTGEWFAHTPEVADAIAHVLATGQLPLTPDTDREGAMAERYLAGETLQQIGDAYSLTRERVRQLLRKAGVPTLGLRAQHAPQPHPLTNAEIEAARLYQDGMPPKALTERFGIEYFQLRIILKRLGVVRKGVSHWNRRSDDAERTADICRRYQSGEPIAAIAAALGLPAKQHIYRYLQKGGVATSRKPGSGNWSSAAEAKVAA